jgi:2-oxoglutarate ferredoxin oxidoreductase subunit gamma
VIVGHAAICDGRWVAGSSSYGAQARGGYARSDVVISDEPIIFPHVLKADILIAMSQQAYDRYIGDIAPHAVVLFEEQEVTIKALEGVTQIGIPATLRAIEEIGQKQVANIVMVGATVALTKAVSKEALRLGVRENVDERFLASNLESVELGFSMGEER